MIIECSFVSIRNPRAQSRLHWQLPASCVQYHRMQDRPTILLRWGAWRMTHRRIVLIAVLVAAAHFVLSSLLCYYAAYEVGGRAGENIARLITETYESKDAPAEAAIVERYRNVKKSIDETAARWQPAFLL